MTVEYEPFQEFLRHLRRLRTLTSNALVRIDSLSELRSVIRKHPGLAQAKVGDAMTSPPPTLPLTGNFASAISHFQKIKQTAFVVVDDGGRFRDLHRDRFAQRAVCALRSLETPLSEIMVHPVVTIAQSEPLSKAMNTFLLEPVKRLVVVDDNDPTRPVGLLTLFDIVVHYASHEADFVRAQGSLKDEG